MAWSVLVDIHKVYRSRRARTGWQTDYDGATMNIAPSETVLSWRWVSSGGRLVADAVCKRIFALTESHLVKIGSDPSGWDVLYRDPVDGRFWELIYPESELHGGGAPQLRCLAADEAAQKYGFHGGRG